ncbi:cysteine-rich receptor-like protein kinase 8 [Tanacetum coccineum]
MFLTTWLLDHMLLQLYHNNALNPCISNSLNFLNTTASLWNELQEHYSQLDGHRIYQLTNDLVQLKQNNYAIEVFYHKLKGLWDECDALEAPYMCVCACSCKNGRVNGDRDQRKRLIQFLIGLDECYVNVRGQILLMQPMPTVAKAYGLIRQEEKQREGYVQQTTNSAALYAHSNYARPTYHNNNRANRNFTQGESSNRNSNQSDVIVRRSTFRKGVICGNCSKEGHLSEECYKLKHLGSTPTTLNEADLAMSARMDQLQNQLNQMMLLMQQNSSDGTGLNTFNSAVDSGATDHICITLTSMYNVRLCKHPIYITLPNGHHTQVRHIGSVYINPSITLHDVMTSTRGLLMEPSVMVSTSLSKRNQHQSHLPSQSTTATSSYGMLGLDILLTLS